MRGGKSITGLTAGYLANEALYALDEIALAIAGGPSDFKGYGDQAASPIIFNRYELTQSSLKHQGEAATYLGDLKHALGTRFSYRLSGRS